MELEGNCNECWYSEKLNQELLVFNKDEKGVFKVFEYDPMMSSFGESDLELLESEGFKYMGPYERPFKYSTPKPSGLQVGMAEDFFNEDELKEMGIEKTELSPEEKKSLESTQKKINKVQSEIYMKAIIDKKLMETIESF